MSWWQFIIWNDEPGENVDKIGQHGLTIADVEHVLLDPEVYTTSKSTGRPAVIGHTPAGERIFVVFDDVTIEPITVYLI